jgi:hypothetical protein
MSVSTFCVKSRCVYFKVFSTSYGKQRSQLKFNCSLSFNLVSFTVSDIWKLVDVDIIGQYSGCMHAAPIPSKLLVTHKLREGISAISEQATLDLRELRTISELHHMSLHSTYVYSFHTCTNNVCTYSTVCTCT